ncbi:MAG TPA: TetR/AcrR family transcriptional regulator, partial [Casimicrobiaceae bacterium]|nr:TetR/AcrR family transcriptional regulator [Casimicrobiaceae bacterium]
GSDMPRQSLAVREASALRVERLIEAVRDTLPGVSRVTAAVITATMVGSLQLARALGDNDEGRALLAAARDALIRQHDRPRKSAQ